MNAEWGCAHNLRRVSEVRCASQPRCKRIIIALLGAAGAICAASTATAQSIDNPILFVTQVPIPGDFVSVGSVFGNHRAALESCGRGGDLWIRYPDGTLRNLTAAAGFGSTGQQGANAIAVRDPSVHWNGQKALFSMVVGAPTHQYDYTTFYWQMYEITGLGAGQTPVITRIPNQPTNYNNVTPIYGTDDSIIFTSDRPRDGSAHLYPQLDEYEEAATTTGIWRLTPTGALQLLNHAPSGDFSPSIDSFGRLIFTQWDHLQRDQQADSDAYTPAGQQLPYGTFNWTSEAVGSQPQFGVRPEVFPEPRSERTDLLQGTNLRGHSFNHFFIWQCNEDGSDLEILNHLGRHELHAYIPASITGDANVFDYYGQLSRFNQRPINNSIQPREDPTTPGRIYAIDAPEFQTHASGQIIRIDAPPTLDADHITVTYITHRDTSQPDDSPASTHSGLYRDPLPISSGLLIAAHTSETRADTNTGTRTNPGSRYALRLKTIISGPGGYFVAGAPLTSGLGKSVSYWDPDYLVTYSGEFWELQPVEVRPRPRPPTRTTPLPQIESQIFADAGVAVGTLQNYLVANNLALIVARDVTTRDDFDFQQPYNLRVAGGGTQTIGRPGAIYDISQLEIFQADQIRGLSYNNVPRAGRRVLAQRLHDPAAIAANPPPAGGAAPATVRVAADGSVAAFVPARRALTWQLLGPSATPVVRERNWLTLQPGEIRVCTSCHGPSQYDQAGQAPPTNPPQALRDLLTFWANGQVRTADMNCDGVVNNFDVDPFVLALTNATAWSAAYPNCSLLAGDINHDGHFDNFDIDPFVSCVLSGCP